MNNRTFELMYQTYGRLETMRVTDNQYQVEEEQTDIDNILRLVCFSPEEDEVVTIGYEISNNENDKLYYITKYDYDGFVSCLARKITNS